MSVLIRGVRLYGEGDPVDVLVDDGQIAEIGSGLAGGTGVDDTIIEATGQILLPGFVDMHTHLREPGREDTETIETGSAAAALGGYTAVFAMANTNPVADSSVITDHVWHRGQQVGLVDVHPVGAITVGLAGRQLTEMAMMAAGAGQVRMFSDDGICVQDPLVMRRALEYATGLGVLIAQHAEEPRLTVDAVAHEGPTAARLGLAGWPRVAEESIVARDALLARDAGARVHICHASTAGTVELLKWAKAQGISITAEVTPHHLLLDDSRLAGYDGVNKVNPPLREASDAQALRQALADGVIDCVATACPPRHARPADRAVRGGGDHGQPRPADLAWCRGGDEREPRPHRRPPGSGPPAGGGGARQPDHRRPRRHLGGRGYRPGQQVGQHPVPGDDAAGHGDGNPVARHRHGTGREDLPVNTGTLVGSLIFAAVIAIAIAVFITLMLRGWKRRALRQIELIGRLPALPDAVGPALTGPIKGLYVGSTVAPSWQDRIAVGDLGYRTKAVLTRYPEGIMMQRSGVTPIWIPDDSITAIRTERGIAGKAMTHEGILAIRWKLPSGTEIDTGFRGDNRNEYSKWVTPGTDGAADGTPQEGSNA
ncbi:MAG: pyrC [Mycobacterium sp.]|nr:pyrC [Mycobacterium sp.]